jgi:predicted dehydrogenase
MAETETFVKERIHQETGKVLPVGIDDACMVMARFANGSMGLFESTRSARGHKALKTLELNGEAGSVFFDLHDDQWLSFFEYRTPAGDKTPSHTTGWRKIHVTNSEHPYMDHYWVPGTTIGYEHTFLNALADFVIGLETGKPVQPDFRNALQTQKVCDMVIESARTGQWRQTGVDL